MPNVRDGLRSDAHSLSVQLRYTQDLLQSERARSQRLDIDRWKWKAISVLLLAIFLVYVVGDALREGVL